MKKLLLSLALSLAAVSAVSAQSLTGEWDGAMNTPGGLRTFKLLFRQEGEKLTGTVKRESGDVPLEGTVVGNTVKFAYGIAYGGNPITLAVTATLSGNEMKGEVDIAGQVKEEFSAKRAAPAAAGSAARPPQ
jgi:hypothetical protein